MLQKPSKFCVHLLVCIGEKGLNEKVMCQGPLYVPVNVKNGLIILQIVG